MDGEPDLAKIRDEAWKYFVPTEDRRVFATDATISKVHPVSGAELGTYEISGDPEFFERPEAARFKEEPADLSRLEWRLCLCTGLCRSKHIPGGGRRARCWEGSGPYDLCLARRLQLHPQARALDPRHCSLRERK